MGSEWFFSSWFMYRNSELPREPDWLREDDDSVQLRADERSTPVELDRRIDERDGLY